ncbi:chromate transporter [Kaistia sp. 32K]|uniref:chromate efflux transporter n=1 Tax=Kaistia sp. 32K TaxID=2795690 RepID=UPI00191608F4|nr:chromate efflux transporter [Kaistia sp. 32K]BCP55097.1 chromate transporter [Kaistia sp. 32K]
MNELRTGPLPSEPPPEVSAGRVFLEFLKLGLTSFGGPVAHIGYFRDRFVRRLRWLDEEAFADLLALCQFLPGPASSQLGMAIGLEKAGLGGALAAFVGFTLPSALIMAVLAFGFAAGGDRLDAGVLSGLAVVAVAVVAEAVRGMAMSLARGWWLGGIAVAATILVVLSPGGATQIAILLAAGLAGYALGPSVGAATVVAAHPGISRGAGLASLLVFFLLLFGLPLAAHLASQPELALFGGLYRSGALVFGGGHVVLPLLQDAVVAPGFISDRAFVAGYGAAQAMPGPLFSLSAWIGVAAGLPDPVSGALLAVLALFAPGLLLVLAVMPFWQSLRRIAPVRRALAGINAAVVGLLAAALYDPVFTTAIHGMRELLLALACYALLVPARIPAWGVVLFAAFGGWWIH